VIKRVWLAGIGLLVIGCQPGGQTNVRPGTGLRFASPSDLKPEASPGTDAVLVARGMKIPVEIKHTVENANVLVSLFSHGEEIEAEHYVRSGTGFELVSAAGEIYHPPLPLLWFPLTVGDEREWNGQMESGGEKRNASAKISILTDQLFEAVGSPQAVKVQVNLEIQNGTPTPADRQLVFWFVPGKGALKREFGKGLTRVPTPTPGSE
jgi:hypothetical protein